MNIAEFHFSNGNKTQAQIEDSNEKIFKIFLEKRLKNYNQYIKATKDIIKECKRLNIVNRDDFDTFQINSIEVLTNLLFELKNGLLREYDLKSSNRCPHACIKSHYLEFVKYVNAYKNYVSKDMVKYLKTRGGEKEFKVEIKNQKIEIIASINNIRKYSSNRFLEYSVLGKNEVESYAKPLFEDILSNSNLSAIKQSENEKILIENQNIPLNQILYGPPGTGKTYHTIDKALEILGENLESRDEKKAKFDEYVRKGQIVFTTFHQSYGYEEFVEGIKPIIDNDENSQEVKYDVKDGIFKELCDKSLKNYILSMQNENEIDLDKLIFEFANYINQDFLNKGNEFPLENKVSIKKILLNFKDEYRSFSLGGSIKSPQSLTIDIIKRDYLNFKNKKILSFKDIKPKYDSQSDYHGNAIYYFMFYNKLKEFENIQNEKFKIKKEILKSYIIIIDEINRGNVSKIFGELITLIEPSKRIGEKEELKVTLPYSGEKFGVPKNVYIIGTMNTADRSITSLDTALRRRFEFIEMMPDVSKLSMDCEGINLQELLKAINTRIEYLLDREKTIGHAFFVSVENLEDLKKVFQNKIIPLLQEYFYNDYALINEVLNDNGMIFEDKKDDKYLQKIKNLDSVNSERSIYNIASFDDKIWDKIEIYQAIYNDEIANKLKNENE
ncbi:AAA domain-containing protein [Campylobacter jejuni]|uniref:AAA family ATPase n=1 Tax=Campylobacter jejuni TaxID=197 RepID=A0A5Y9JFS5_CAMJU|nr:MULTISPECIES: AAA family ATPase [Campylobacter]EAH4556483.1 AAA family ATPase [Campylobacter jejuni]EAH4729080.1 AAA family ATPase [Campylobacter jejuni]EAH5085493.1 AAA family ATPase [Campylobacter jejuni]EAH5414396.1 AAA family ATPase [Campylobacter jejuni]EAH5545048.1 AAA family ATPase [Campylobacter jejuni]